MGQPADTVFLDPTGVGAENAELIPLSYLSQYYYCSRRAGLLLLEQQWQDNIYTAEGEAQHARVHDHGMQTRVGSRILRSVRVVSYTMGLSGVTDCVELSPCSRGATIPGLSGEWSVSIIEYKHGRVRGELEYDVQVCAQAMCLEEQMGVAVDRAEIFYASAHRRKVVELTFALRELVVQGAKALHQMLREGRTPAAALGPKCRKCSMTDLCSPGLNTRALSYIAQMRREAVGETS